MRTTITSTYAAITAPDCPWQGVSTSDGTSLACGGRGGCQCLPTVPVVEINRVSVVLTTSDEEWEPVSDGTTETETWDPEWDLEDYGTPIVWAAARVRDLSCGLNFEPSVYPLPADLPERAWLSATYENPYLTERIETSAYVYGISETDRAEVFRLAMLPGPEWVAIVHAHRYEK
jgi:hypothetical protein